MKSQHNRGGTTIEDDIMAKTIDRPLECFTRLPDEALIDDKTVAGIFGCSRNTVWRRAKAGGIWPKAIRISAQQTRFRVGDVRNALAALSAA